MQNAQQNAQNVIICNDVTLNIKKAHLPFSNNFVQLSAKIVQVTSKRKEVYAQVLCTANSLEPGRIYAVVYNMRAQLLECCTLN